LKRQAFGLDPDISDGKRHFTAHFWFVGWDCISLGLHICLSKPNIEVHIPFGFFKIGWEGYVENWGF
jgi:hypothetical protein